MSLRSPLAKVLGLGSAGDGTAHWWAQRVTAVAMVILGVWFALSLPGLDLTDRESVASWVAAPLNSVLLILLIAVGAYHSQLGTRVVIEDYSRGWAKVTGLIAVQFIHVVLAGAGILAVVRVGTGG
ncbi:MAG: succinate dehydrogenase, hydrophobic membrane anchor protein [Gammaproteobacteria bacterium]|nr:MAG: succinate dehydrogenase, hydrophobic membrane anchor protein [Gammaproteobacteria bacterium]